MCPFVFYVHTNNTINILVPSSLYRHLLPYRLPSNRLYIINQEHPIHAAMLTSLSLTLTTWHECLGHINIQRLKAMRDGSIKSITFNEVDIANFKCEACILGKAHRALIHDNVVLKSTVPGHITHWDTC